MKKPAESIYVRLQRAYVPGRGKPEAFQRVLLPCDGGIAYVGYVHRERRWSHGRQGWRWVGYRREGDTYVELTHCVTTDKASCARGVAVRWLEALEESMKRGKR